MKEDFSQRLNRALTDKNMKPVELAEKTGLNKSSISQYINGVYEAKQEALYLIAKALDVNEAWLMGHDVPMDRRITTQPDNIFKIETRNFPLLGTIAAGEPMVAEEHFEGYVVAGAEIHADFCLRIKGDSMIGARILDGDIVFIRQQPDVEDKEIAAVLIDDEATLKRVYKRSDGIILVAENPAYKPIVCQPPCSNIRILGKAVSFQSDVR